MMLRMLYGASFGFFISAIFVGVLVTVPGVAVDHIHAHIIPPLAVSWQERYEMLLYVLALPLGISAGLAASYVVRSCDSEWVLASTFALFVPSVSFFCQTIFREARISVAAALACLGCLAAPALIRRKSEDVGALPWQSWEHIQLLPLRSPTNEGLTFSAYLIVVVLVVTPRSFADTATTFIDPHMASYLLAPALDSLSPAAVPGFDFESHYGLGLPYVFSWFVGNSLEVTTYRASIYFWSLVVIFYASLYLLARLFLRHSGLAFISSLLVLASSFDGFSFSIPSNLPVRFLFIPLLLTCCVWAARGGRSAFRAAAAGVLTGISLFWQTDTGIFAFATGGPFFGILFLSRRIGVIVAAAYILSTLAAFGALLLFVTGSLHNAFSVLMRLLEPIFLYSGGFGGVLLVWDTPWSQAYDVLFPCVAIASVAASCLALFKLELRPGHATDAVVPQYLLLLSLFGYLSLTKWVNRSIDLLWWLNGWPIVLVLFFWSLYWVRRIETLKSLPVVARRLAAPAALVLGLGILFLRGGGDLEFGLSRAPALRWAFYFRAHPGLLSDFVFFASGEERHPDGRRRSRPVTPEDSEFIRTRTNPEDRVVVVSKFDWLYLTDAERPSALHWLPLFLTHSDVLLSRNIADIERADRVFLDNDVKQDTGYWGIPSLREYPAYAPVMKLLSDCFDVGETSTRWSVLTNRCRAAR